MAKRNYLMRIIMGFERSTEQCNFVETFCGLFIDRSVDRSHVTMAVVKVTADLSGLNKVSGLEFY